MIEQKAAAAEGSGISALRHASHRAVEPGQPAAHFGLQERDKTGTEEEHTKQKGRGSGAGNCQAVNCAGFTCPMVTSRHFLQIINILYVYIYIYILYLNCMMYMCLLDYTMFRVCS